LDSRVGGDYAYRGRNDFNPTNDHVVRFKPENKRSDNMHYEAAADRSQRQQSHEEFDDQEESEESLDCNEESEDDEAEDASNEGPINGTEDAPSSQSEYALMVTELRQLVSDLKQAASQSNSISTFSHDTNTIVTPNYKGVPTTLPRTSTPSSPAPPPTIDPDEIITDSVHDKHDVFDESTDEHDEPDKQTVEDESYSDGLGLNLFDIAPTYDEIVAPAAILPSPRVTESIDTTVRSIPAAVKPISFSPPVAAQPIWKAKATSNIKTTHPALELDQSRVAVNLSGLSVLTFTQRLKDLTGHY